MSEHQQAAELRKGGKIRKGSSALQRLQIAELPFLWFPPFHSVLLPLDVLRVLHDER
jgi:hypothetical protein